jgi:hypothetical protein
VTTQSTPRKLTLDDIADVRQYGRERHEFSRHVIELKRRRRVAVGPVVTFLFVNRDTIRFQIQEMARVEKLTIDAAIQAELDIYNPMIPEPGHLCATMFIELTTDEQLVDIERSVLLGLSDEDVVRALVDEQHQQGLIREHVTAAVHYLRFELTPQQVEVFTAGPVALSIDHPAYRHGLLLAEATHDELVTDLR